MDADTFTTLSIDWEYSQPPQGAAPTRDATTSDVSFVPLDQEHMYNSSSWNFCVIA